MADMQGDEFERLGLRGGDPVDRPREGDTRPPRRSLLPWAISGLLFALLLGLLASPWFEHQVRSTIPGAFAAERQAGVDPRLDQLEDRVSQLEAARSKVPGPAVAAPVVPGSLAQRLAALEVRAQALQSDDGALRGRVEGLAADLARTSGAIVESDQRMRDLFLLAVARRMLEAGRPLTPIQSGLEGRFGNRDAAALDALAAWSNAPQTVTTLQGRLSVLKASPSLTESSAGGWWERLKASLSGLVRVKGEEAREAVSPEEVVAETQAALVGGDPLLAAERIERLGTADAKQWAADARLLQGAKQALDRLEGLAIQAALADVQAAALPAQLPPVNGQVAP